MAFNLVKSLFLQINKVAVRMLNSTIPDKRHAHLIFVCETENISELIPRLLISNTFNVNLAY